MNQDAPPEYNSVNILAKDESSDSTEQNTNPIQEIEKNDHAVFIKSEGFFFKTIKLYVTETKYCRDYNYVVYSLTKTQAYNIYNYIIKHHGIIKKIGRVNELHMSYEQAVNLLDQLYATIKKDGDLNSIKQKYSDDKYTLLFIAKNKSDEIYVRVKCDYDKYDESVDYNKTLINGENWEYCARGNYRTIMEVRDYLLPNLW